MVTPNVVPIEPRMFSLSPKSRSKKTEIERHKYNHNEWAHEQATSHLTTLSSVFIHTTPSLSDQINATVYPNTH
jgi:hypothetical protein